MTGASGHRGTQADRGGGGGGGCGATIQPHDIPCSPLALNHPPRVADGDEETRRPADEAQQQSASRGRQCQRAYHTSHRTNGSGAHYIVILKIKQIVAANAPRKCVQTIIVEDVSC